MQRIELRRVSCDIHNILSGFNSGIQGIDFGLDDEGTSEP